MNKETNKVKESYFGISRLIKALILFTVPLAFVCVVYLLNSPSKCFYPPDNFNSEYIEKVISDNLNSEHQIIDNLSPVIQFGNWFKYDIFIENRYGFMYASSDSGPYFESTSTFNVITKYGTTTIPYGSKVVVIKGININEITTFITRSFGSSPIVVSNLSNIDSSGRTHFVIRNINNSSICVYTKMQKNPYLFLMYFVCFAFIIGILILVKEAVNFICKDMRKYFNPD